MKRWSAIVVVLVSISIVGLTVLILAHPKNGGPTSPEAVRYVETVCNDVDHGLPTPPLSAWTVASRSRSRAACPRRDEKRSYVG